MMCDVIDDVCDDVSVCGVEILEITTDTLISALSFLLKQANKILRCPGLSPSSIEGIERTLSAIEK